MENLTEEHGIKTNNIKKEYLIKKIRL